MGMRLIRKEINKEGEREDNLSIPKGFLPAPIFPKGVMREA
jgi:hypothetical protein